MGNINCKSVLTNYVVTTNPYYKLHYLLTVILFGLLYFNYLKDLEFDDVENKFIVFLSKYIFMPYIINYGLSIVFFNMVELYNRKLIDKAVNLCGTTKVNQLTDKNLDDLVKRANKLINPSTSTSRSPKTGSPKAQNNTNTSSTK